MLSTQIFFFLLSFYSSLAESILFETSGEVYTDFLRPFSDLGVYLIYPNIDLSLSTKTNSNGNFDVSFYSNKTLMLNGKLKIIDEHDRFDEYNHEVTNYLGAAYKCILPRIILNLKRAYVKIYGIIKEENGNFLENVNISISFNQNNFAKQKIASNLNGEFEYKIPKVFPGLKISGEFKFYKKHYASQKMPFAIEMNEFNEYILYTEVMLLPIKIKNKFQIEGNLIDKFGVGIFNSLVKLTIEEVEYNTNSNEDGFFNFLFEIENEDNNESFPIDIVISQENFREKQIQLIAKNQIQFYKNLGEILLVYKTIESSIFCEIVNNTQPIKGIQIKFKITNGNEYLVKKPTNNEFVTNENGLFSLIFEILKGKSIFFNIQIVSNNYIQTTSGEGNVSLSNNYCSKITISIDLSDLTAKIFGKLFDLELGKYYYGHLKIIGKIKTINNYFEVFNFSKNNNYELYFPGKKGQIYYVELEILSKIFFIDKLNFSLEKNNSYLIEKSLDLKRKNINVSFNTNIKDYIDDFAISGCKVALSLKNINITDENLIYVEEKSDMIGGVKIKTQGKAGFTYEGKIEAECEFYERYQLNPILFNRHNFYNVELFEILLTRTKIATKIEGIILDTLTNRPIKNYLILFSFSFQKVIHQKELDFNLFSNFNEGNFEYTVQLFKNSSYLVRAEIEQFFFDTKKLLFFIEDSQIKNLGIIFITRKTTFIKIKGNLKDIATKEIISDSTIFIFGSFNIRGEANSDDKGNFEIELLHTAAGADYLFSLNIYSRLFEVKTTDIKIDSLPLTGYETNLNTIELIRKKSFIAIHIKNDDRLEELNLHLTSNKFELSYSHKNITGDFIWKELIPIGYDYKGCITLKKKYSENYVEAFSLNSSDYNFNLKKPIFVPLFAIFEIQGKVIDSAIEKPIMKAEILLFFNNHKKNKKKISFFTKNDGTFLYKYKSNLDPELSTNLTNMKISKQFYNRKIIEIDNGSSNNLSIIVSLIRKKSKLKLYGIYFNDTRILPFSNLFLTLNNSPSIKLTTNENGKFNFSKRIYSGIAVNGLIEYGNDQKKYLYFNSLNNYTQNISINWKDNLIETFFTGTIKNANNTKLINAILSYKIYAKEDSNRILAEKSFLTNGNYSFSEYLNFFGSKKYVIAVHVEKEFFVDGGGKKVEFVSNDVKPIEIGEILMNRKWTMFQIYGQVSDSFDSRNLIDYNVILVLKRKRSLKTDFSLQQNIDKVISLNGAIPLGYEYICYLDILKDQYDDKNISFTLNHKNKYQKIFNKIALIRKKVGLFVAGKIIDEISRESITGAALIFTYYSREKHSFFNFTDKNGQFYQALFSKAWNISTISFLAQKRRFLKLSLLLKINQTHLIVMERKQKNVVINGSLFIKNYEEKIPLKNCKIFFSQNIYNITQFSLESNNYGLFKKTISMYDIEFYNISISINSYDQALNNYERIYFVENLKFLEDLNIVLHRKEIQGDIKGKCINSNKHGLENVQLFFIIQKKNETIDTTLTDIKGNFEKKIDLLQGINTSIQIIAFKIGYELSKLNISLTKENNYMVRHHIEINKLKDSFLVEKIGSIYGFVFDRTTNLPIELSSITAIFNQTTNYSSESKNKGFFNLSFKYINPENPVIIIIKSEKYYKYKKIVMFPQKNSSQLNLEKVFLKRKKNVLNINGSVKNIDNTFQLKEVEIIIKLCFLNCSEKIIFSDKNGSFSFTRKLEVERNYNFSLKMKKKGFNNLIYQSYFFTELKKTLLDLGDFFLSPRQIKVTLQVKLLDKMNFPIRNASIMVFNKEKYVNNNSDNNGQCEFSFKIFARKMHHFEFVIKHSYYELKKQIISFSAKADEIKKLKFYLKNRKKNFLFSGSLLDDYDRTKISNACIIFELCNLKCLNLTKKSDIFGSYSFPVILKLGMEYKIKMFLTAEHFLSNQVSYYFFSKIDNTMTVFPEILLTRKKISVVFTGELKNTTFFPVEGVKVRIFSLNVSSSSNNEGIFFLPIDCLEGRNYNYKINFKKIGYKEKNLNESFKCNLERKKEISIILEKSMSFAYVEGFLIDNYTKESLQNIKIYLKICEFMHLLNCSEYKVNSDEFGHFKLKINYLNFIEGKYNVKINVSSEFFYEVSKEAICDYSHDYYVNFDTIILKRLMKRIKYTIWIKDKISNENLTNVIFNFQQFLMNKTQLDATLYNQGFSNEVGNYVLDVDLAKGMLYNVSFKLEKNFYEIFFLNFLLYFESIMGNERSIIFEMIPKNSKINIEGDFEDEKHIEKIKGEVLIRIQDIRLDNTTNFLINLNFESKFKFDIILNQGYKYNIVLTYESENYQTFQNTTNINPTDTLTIIDLGSIILKRKKVIAHISGTVLDNFLNIILYPVIIQVENLEKDKMLVKNSLNGTFNFKFSVDKGLNYNISTHAEMKGFYDKNLYLALKNIDDYIIQQNLLLDPILIKLKILAKILDYDSQSLLNDCEMFIQIFMKKNDSKPDSILLNKSKILLKEASLFVYEIDIEIYQKYEVNLIISHKNFENKTLQNEIEINNNRSDFILNLNKIEMHRKQIAISIYSIVKDIETQEKIQNCLVTLIIKNYEDSIIEKANTTTDVDGKFMFSPKLLEGINYTLVFNLKLEHYISNRFILKLNTDYNSTEIYLTQKYLSRKKIEYKLFGKIIDNFTNNFVSNANLLLRINAQNEQNQTEFKRFSNDKGKFFFHFFLNEGFDYVAIIKILVDNYEEKEIRLILTPNQQINMSKIFIARKMVQGKIVGNVILPFTSFLNIKENLGYKEKIIDAQDIILNANSSFTFINKLYQGLQYEGKIIFDSKELYSFKKTFELNDLNNYTLDMGEILMHDKRYVGEVTGKIFSLSEDKPMENSEILALMISQKTNFSEEYNKVSDQNGEFKFKIFYHPNDSYEIQLEIAKSSCSLTKIISFLNTTNNYSLDLGIVYVNLKKIKGVLSGYIIDEITGNFVPFAFLKLNISEKKNLKELQSSTNGFFIYEDDFECNVNYHISLVIVKNNYHYLSQEINLGPHYFNKNFDIKIMRLFVSAQITGLIFDNFTRNPVLTEQIYLNYYYKTKFGSKTAKFEIIGDQNGVFNLKFNCFAGLHYVLEIYSQASENSAYENLKKIGFLNSTNDYSIKNLNVELERKKKSIAIKGYIFDNETKIGINSNITFKLFWNNSLLDAKSLNSDYNGNYEIILDSLLIGIVYDLKFQTRSKYYDALEFQKVIRNKNSYLLKNAMVRIKYQIEFKGIVLSSLHNSALDDTNVTIEINENGFYSPLFSINSIYSNTKGEFLLSKELYAGVNYDITFFFSKNFYLDKIIKNNLNFSENFSYNLENILLDSEKDKAKIFVKILEQMRNEIKSIANIKILILFWYDDQISKNNAITDEKGEFNFDSDFFLTEIYYAQIKIINENFTDYESEIIKINSLTTSASFRIVLNRIDFIITVIGRIKDKITFNYIKNAEVKLILQNNYLKSDISLLNKTDEKGKLSFNLILKKGIFFDFTLAITAQYFISFSQMYKIIPLKKNEILLEEIEMERKFIISLLQVSYYDIDEKSYVNDAVIIFSIEPKIFNDITNFTDNKGTVTFSNQIYEGLNYEFSLKIKKFGYDESNQSFNISEKYNYTSIHQNIININKKNVTFRVSGIAQDEYSNLLNNLTVQIKFSWETDFRSTHTEESGIFTLNLEMKMFENIEFLMKINDEKFKPFERNISINAKSLFSDKWDLWVFTLEKPILLRLANTVENNIAFNFSKKFQKITLQVLYENSCTSLPNPLSDVKALLYPAGNYAPTAENKQILAESLSNEQGSINLKAPLLFYDANEEISAHYTAFLKLSKNNFYEKEISVKIGGGIWWMEMNLGVEYMIKITDDECKDNKE